MQQAWRGIRGRGLANACCVEDLRALAKARVPKPFWEYVESGSWTQSTLERNTSDFADILFRQKILKDIGERDVSSELAGQHCSMPVALSPCGFGGMMFANGEVEAALAAEKFGVPFALSTMSIGSIEDVAAATSKPFWFQLYVMRDRGFVSDLILRAKAAKCSALILTVDLQVLGKRHADVKNGLAVPPKPTLQSAINILSRPAWCVDMLRSRRWSFGNIVGHAKRVSNMASLSSWTAEQFDPTLSWKDVEWVKKQWGGTLIIKGVMDPEDAVLAALSGADAVVVSNHGGRQLDGAPSSLSALPPILEALEAANLSSMEVWLDGGVRSGQDVLRAVALGASGVMVGRPWLYGLGAAGGDGVTRCLEIIKEELELSMAFCGHRSIKDVSRDILLPPRKPFY